MGTMDYRIRKATKDDIHDLALIYHRSWKFAYNGIIDRSFLDSMSLEKRIEKFNSMEYIPEYLFEYRGKIVGCSRLIDSRDEDPECCAEIQTIYFLPEYTGMGLGILFLKELKVIAVENKYKHMIVWCLSDNSKAIRAYEKAGFHKDNNRSIEIGNQILQETRFRYDL